MKEKEPMKKILALMLSLMLLFSASALAKEESALSAPVYVSITDENGALVMAYEEITVTDADADGLLTLNDALACAHAKKHPLGAEAYSASATEWGLSLMKLWNVENGGSYGYCLNDASAWSLNDPVAAGDHVKAYVYTDLEPWSDTYCFFDMKSIQCKPGEEIALVLSAVGFDESYAPMTLPVADASLTVNGEATQLKTDAEGRVTLTLKEAGNYVISAVSDTMRLVAPVCVITAAAEE